MGWAAGAPIEQMRRRISFEGQTVAGGLHGSKVLSPNPLACSVVRSSLRQTVARLVCAELPLPFARLPRPGALHGVCRKERAGTAFLRFATVLPVWSGRKMSWVLQEVLSAFLSRFADMISDTYCVD